MDISFDRQVKVPPRVLYREVDEEAVLLNLDSEVYFGLDDVGTVMWAELVGSGSITEAYEKLLVKYDVAPDELRQDLEHLISELIDQGLLVLVEE